MTEPQLTPLELSCANAYRLLKLAIELRDRLADRLDELDPADLDQGFQFDRIYHLLSCAERRVLRRRVRWLQLQRDVFDAIGRTAGDLRTACDDEALRAGLSWQALRSLVPR